MKKRFFIVFLTITLALISVGVYASESSELNQMNIVASCPSCDIPNEYALTVSHGYTATATTHTMYDRYEGTCEACGHYDYIDFPDNPESHSFTHIHKEINGSYADLYKCTVCGYEVYNND